MEASLLQAISAMIPTGKAENLFRIKSKWLVDDEVIQYHFVREYVIEYDEFPPFEVINSRFSTKLPLKCGRFGYEVENLKNRFIYLQLATKLPGYAKTLKTNPKKTVSDIQDTISDLLEDDAVRDVDLALNAINRLDRYKARIGTGGVTHLSMGHPILDKLFYGYAKNDLITIGGRAGVGKSWLLIVLALLAEMVMPAEKGPILFVTNEMGLEEVEDRFDANRFKLPYGDFIAGKLNRVQVNSYRRGLEALQLKGGKIKLIDRCYHLDDLRHKVLLYRPSLLYIDGSYLMEPSFNGKDWEKITHVTRSLKRLAKETNTPTINNTQMRKGTGTKKATSSFDAQDDFSFASSYTMDSDLAFRAYQTPQMLYNNSVGLDIAKGRRVIPGVSLVWKHDLTKCTDDFVEDTDDEYATMAAVADSPEKDMEINTD